MGKKKRATKIGNFKKLYYDSSSGAYLAGSAAILFNEYKSQKLKPPIKLDDVKKYLSAQSTYTIHRKALYKVKTNPIYTRFIGDVVAIDLAEMGAFSKDNSGYNYIFCAIDTFSKKGYAYPLVEKTAKECLKVLEKLLSEFNYRVFNLCADNGNEFKAVFDKFCVKKGINLYRVQGHQKNAIAERFIRTLKEKIWRYFRLKGVAKWDSILPKIVDSYNDTPHSSIKMRPKDVDNANSHIVFNTLFPNAVVKKKPKLSLGDIVKFSKTFKTMQKSYEGRYSLSSYRIKDIKYPPGGDLPMYRLEEAYSGKAFDGTRPYWWYEQDLQKVDKKTYASAATMYDIDVIKSKGKHSLIQFLDYPDDKQEWVLTSSLILK